MARKKNASVPGRLGKKEYEHDPRTMVMRDMFVPEEFSVPNTWDFDARRSKLPMGLWGNEEFGDCVLVGRGNQMVRNERIETRRTLPLSTAQVVDKYKEMTGCVTPGDEHDTGLYVIDALRDWRHGWDLTFGKTQRTYTIAAFGALDDDHTQLRAAAFLLNGIQFGIWLPETAWTQYRNGEAWDDTGTDEPAAQPGSWGGHLVYAKHFDEGGFWCITWGGEQYMTNRFITRYADERWAIVDALNNHSRYLNVDKMIGYLRSIGASGIE
jgi:hypothetical protein